MKDIKQILEDLAFYYETTRQIGHTTAMLRGAYNTDNALVLTATMDHARTLERTTPSNVTAKSLSDTDSLCGTKKPLFIDNFAMSELLYQARSRILSLENEVKSLKVDIANLTFSDNTQSKTPLADEFYEKYATKADLNEEEVKELEAVLDLMYDNKHKEMLEVELAEKTKTTHLDDIVEAAVSRSKSYKFLFGRK